MKLTEETVSDSLNRGGKAADNRPDRIDEVIDSDQLGFREGKPLVEGYSYAEYPSRDDLSTPQYRGFLKSLLFHHKVSSLADAVSELTGGSTTTHLTDWLNAVENAVEAYGIDAETLLEKGDDDVDVNPIEEILGYEPAVDDNNPLLIGELYAVGLGVEEITKVVGDSSVTTGYVRDRLKDLGLLQGATREETKTAFEENEGRLGGTTINQSERNPSVNIDAEKVENSSNITVNSRN